MSRMFVEGFVHPAHSDREGVQVLMRELDNQAANERHRIVGDVTIYEVEGSRSAFGRMLRLEAEAVPK